MSLDATMFPLTKTRKGDKLKQKQTHNDCLHLWEYLPRKKEKHHVFLISSRGDSSPSFVISAKLCLLPFIATYFLFSLPFSNFSKLCNNTKTQAPRKMTAMACGEYTSVKDFYRDRSIFITGGTGFMGKVLVEKLLRSCPGIKNIYLLMRPKKGQNVQQRLQELLNAPVS